MPPAHCLALGQNQQVKDLGITDPLLIIMQLQSIVNELNNTLHRCCIMAGDGVSIGEKYPTGGSRRFRGKPIA